jgi:Cu-Zn family superoxide dismutase
MTEDTLFAPKWAAPCALALAFLAGCASTATPPRAAASGPRATAALQPTTGNAVTGTVQFVQAGGQVRVSGEVRGLKPNAEHGFHVHEKGDCSSGDGMSTGGHFNPGGKPHGQHGQAAQHAGDLVSLKANASGVAAFSFESSAISVGAGPTDVVGKGLIVHRDPDDYKTQPTGNAGPRLACAVIVRS